MKRKQRLVGAVVRFVLFLAVTVMNHRGASAEEGKQITSAICTNFELADIPVGSFKGVQQKPEMHDGEMRITQKYNQPYEEGYCNAPGQPPVGSLACVGRKIYFGHSGIDIHEQGVDFGVNDVFASQDGWVIVSHQSGTFAGWGETIITASRANQYSEEILTQHYHHLHYTGNGVNYQTTRRFNACETVMRGYVLAKEGTSGTPATHLHFTVRRWKNIEELKNALQSNGKSVYGAGYSFGNDTSLAKHLDPQGLLYGTFRDFQGNNPIPYDWAMPFAVEMRENGIEYGLFDGRFGSEEPVKRREAACWLKIAAEQESFTPPVSTFPDDTPLSDPDSKYIEAMARFPQQEPVVNPNATCQWGLKKFCPDNTINRAETLKMVILTFYSPQFLKIYDNLIWRAAFNQAMNKLTLFQDVSPYSWYAPYVYFGTMIGLVANQPYFYPDNTVTRAEMAKWVIVGSNFLHDPGSLTCANVICGQNQYCDEGQCVPIPQCVPSESQNCEVGGGYNPCADNPECQPNQVETQPCNGNGTQQKICTTDCSWGPWSQCVSSQICQPGETEQQSCNNGMGTQTHTCDSNGQWGAWEVCVPIQQCPCNSGVCCDGCNFTGSMQSCNIDYVYQCEGSNPGQNAQKAMVKTFCSGFDSGCNGATQQFGWQTHEDCSNAQVCTMSGGMSQCVGSCQDVYIAGSSQACYDNPQGAGSPKLCLEINQNSNGSGTYRVCKQGTFDYDFTYNLKDDNHSIVFSEYGSPNGVQCTPWKSYSVNYVSNYGVLNGAGLVVEVVSPSDCMQSSCQYKTGSITVSKECQ